MFSHLSHRQNIVRIIIYFALAIPFVLIFAPFFVPMLLALFFAFGLEPLWRKIGLHHRQKKYFPYILILISILFLFLPVALIGVKIVRIIQDFAAQGTQNSQFFQSMNTLWDKMYAWSMDVLTLLNLEANVFPTKDEIVSKVSPIFVTMTTNFLSSIPEMGLSLLVFFGMLIVIVPRADKIKRYFTQLDILPKNELDEIVISLERNCYMVLVSTFLIGILQAVIVAIGASAFGFHEFFLIFVITFILSFIPVIGAAPVSFVLAIASFIVGQSGNGIGLLVITVVAGSIDNIIKPYVFSGSDDGVHPVIALIGIIGAIVIFGLPGLLLGPLLLQLGAELLPSLTSRTLKALKL